MEAHHGQVLNIASPEMYLSYHLHFGGLCSQRKLLPGCFSAFLSFSFFFFFNSFSFFSKEEKSLFHPSEAIELQAPSKRPSVPQKVPEAITSWKQLFTQRLAAGTLLMARKTHCRWV